MKKSLDGFAVSLQKKSNPLTSPNIQEHVIHDKYWSSIFGYCWIRFHPLIALFEWYQPTEILPDIYSDIFWHSIWHSSWYSSWHICWHFIIHILYIEMCFLTSLYLALFLRFYLTYVLIFYLAFYLTSLLTFCVTSCTCNWGPAVPTEIWLSQLRSGSAHWALALTAEVRQCPLTSGSRSWGPAVPTEIWSSRLCPPRSGARCWGPAVLSSGAQRPLTWQVGKQQGTPKSIGEPPAVLLKWSFGGCHPFSDKAIINIDINHMGLSETWICIPIIAI